MFYGIGKTGAGEKFDGLVWTLVGADEKFGAFGLNSARGGENENIFGAGFSS